MKNILLPTDFSQNAQTAALFAAGLARQFGARLIILHAFNPLVHQGSAGETDPEVAAQAKLDAKARELHQEFGVSTTRLLKPGFAVDEVLALAERVSADLIVLGAQGLSHHADSLMGKVAIELLSTERFPVICFPCLEEEEGEQELLSFLEKKEFCNARAVQLLNELSLPQPENLE